MRTLRGYRRWQEGSGYRLGTLVDWSAVYELALFLHIIAAGIWLGGNVAQFVLNRRFVEEGSGLATFLRGTVDMGTRQYTPAAIILLITGIWLVSQNDAVGFSASFVSIGFAMVIIGGVLGGTVFGPRGREAAALRDAGDDAGARAVESRLVAFGLLDTVLLLVTIAAMVWKLGV